MNKTMYTREDIEAVYDEVDRRVEYPYGDFENICERWDYRNAMLQGVYTALMVQARNWTEVASWCSEIEYSRYDAEFEAVVAARKKMVEVTP